MRNIPKSLVAVVLGLGLIATSTAPAQTPPISSDQKKLILAGIKQNREVLGARIEPEKDNRITLILMVRYGTSEVRAKQLADNFVRMTMTLGPDKNPGKEIGKSRYDYPVGVFYPNE